MNPASDAGRVHSAAFLSKDTLLWLWAPLPWCIHEHRRTVTATRQVMACKLWWISIQSRNQQYCWSRHVQKLQLSPGICDHLWSALHLWSLILERILTYFPTRHYYALNSRLIYFWSEVRLYQYYPCDLSPLVKEAFLRLTMTLWALPHSKQGTPGGPFTTLSNII